VVIRGPIYVYDPSGAAASYRPRNAERGHRTLENLVEEIDEDKTRSASSSHVVMVGVPAEVAAAIALASFAVGAALMAFLCCLHNRNGNSKVRVLIVTFQCGTFRSSRRIERETSRVLIVAVATAENCKP